MNGLPPDFPAPQLPKQGIVSSFVSGQSAKCVVALLTAATMLLQHWSGRWWEPAAVGALGAVALWLAPNAPKSGS